MPELIDRDALKNHLYRAQAEAFKHSEWYVAGAIQSFINILGNLPTIEADIDRAAILRQCNEIECIVHEIYNTEHMMQNCDYDAILNRVKKIGKELTENEQL